MIIKISSVNSEIFQICRPCTFFLLCLKRFFRQPPNTLKAPLKTTPGWIQHPVWCIQYPVWIDMLVNTPSHPVGGKNVTLLFQYGDTSDVGSCRNQSKRRELKYRWHLKGQIRDFSGDFKMLLGSWHIVGMPPIDFDLDLSYVFHAQYKCLFIKRGGGWKENPTCIKSFYIKKN